MADRVNQQLGNYRLVRLLGRGGFAEVYLGEHLRLKTQAAIKVLHTSLEKDDVENFLREAQTIAHLKHPTSCASSTLMLKNKPPFWSWTISPTATCAIPIQKAHCFPW